MLNVSNLIGSSADVFTRIVKRHLGDLNHLVEVLYFHEWFHHQFLTILGPSNMRSWPL